VPVGSRSPSSAAPPGCADHRPCGMTEPSLATGRRRRRSGPITAQTEAMIGYVIEHELGHLLPSTPAPTVLTMIEVDPHDPAYGAGGVRDGAVPRRTVHAVRHSAPPSSGSSIVRAARDTSPGMEAPSNNPCLDLCIACAAVISRASKPGRSACSAAVGTPGPDHQGPLRYGQLGSRPTKTSSPASAKT
jgi:hypothetical protein